MRRSRVAAFLVALAAASPLWAGDGAIPVWEPTTITAPGRYVLTRDLASPDNPVITIATLDATLDLNGFTIEGSTGVFAADVVVVSNASSVNIENGTIVGGGAGIGLSNTARQFRLRNLALRGGRTGIRVASSNSVGLIEGNRIESFSEDGIRAGGSALQVRGNVISATPRGIYLDNCRACIVTENTVHNATDTGILLSSGWGNLLLSNTVTGSGFGLRVTTGGNHHLEGNVLVGNTGLGMRLQNTSSGVVYRRNTARNNGGPGSCAGTVITSDLCDEGSGNTSNGDNYMPDKR